MSSKGIYLPDDPQPSAPTANYFVGLAARDLSNSYIAAELNISLSTVKRHLSNVYE